jgi:hypothetical protein
MRRMIETAPRDGKFVILEEDASGKYNVACWSPEVGGWVGEGGEPIKITPTYWYPIEGQKYAQQGLDPDLSVRPAAPQQTTAGAVAASRSVAPAPVTVAEVELQTIPIETTRAWPTRWKFAASAIAASLVAAVFASMHSSEVGSYVTRYASLRDIVGVGAIGGQVDKQAGQPSESEQGQEVLVKELADARRAVDELNLKLQAEAATAAQYLGQEHEKTVALMQDVDAARKALTTSTAQHREALEEERARSSGLASELTSARRDLETKVPPYNNTVDELAQLRKAAEARTAELQQERDRSAALASELATARRDLETKAALSSDAGDELAQLRKATEAKTEELRRSLQQEREKVAALARDLETAKRMSEAPPPAGRTSSGQNGQTKPVTRPAAAEQPVTPAVQGNPEVARLTARAKALLAQGNIGAARSVLERAVEMGSAEASFALAETYDPRILSSWGTYGTRGDASKARELYAKAMVGGIQEAKDRFNTLGQ